MESFRIYFNPPPEADAKDTVSPLREEEDTMPPITDTRVDPRVYLHTSDAVEMQSQTLFMKVGQALAT